jgi:hypothetical protein
MHATANQRVHDEAVAPYRSLFCFVCSPWIHPAAPAISILNIYSLAYEAAVQSEKAQRSFRRATYLSLN